MRREKPEMRPALVEVLRLANEVERWGGAETEGRAGDVNVSCVVGGVIFCEYVDGRRGVVATLDEPCPGGGLTPDPAVAEQSF